MAGFAAFAFRVLRISCMRVCLAASLALACGRVYANVCLCSCVLFRVVGFVF